MRISYWISDVCSSDLTSVSGIAKQFPDCFATLRQIMSHRFAGVYPSLAQVALCPLAERDQLISRHLGTGPSSGYSEYSSQAILLDVIRSLRDRKSTRLNSSH